MGHEPLERIKAPVGHDGVELGQLGAMGLDERFFVRSDVLFQVDRLILRQGRKAAYLVADFFRIEVESLRDQIRVRFQIAGGIAQ